MTAERKLYEVLVEIARQNQVVLDEEGTLIIPVKPAPHWSSSVTEFDIDIKFLAMSK